MWALAGVMLVHFISMLSSTIVANSGPAIVDDLRGLNLYAWVFASYTLAATICVPIVGKLSDTLGRRIFYIVGLVVFFIGTLACGLATSMTELIAFRFIAGAGGGALLALGGATLGDIFPPRQRARWFGLIMTNYGVASMLGPIIGGVITDRFGWRWTFFISLPLTAVALWLMASVLPRIPHSGNVAVDWGGIFLLSAGLLGLLVGLTFGGISYPWTSVQVIGPLVAAAVFLYWFGFHELRTADPVMTPRLFKSPVFLSAVGISFFTRMTFFGLLAFFPVYLQGVLGESASASGLAMVWMMAPFIVGTVVSGQLISRSGRYRVSAIAGPATLLVGVGLCLALDEHSPPVLVDAAMTLVGFGVGVVFPLASTVVQSAFPYRMLGTANSGRQFFDNLGQVVGGAVMTTITLTVFMRELGRLLPPAAKQLLGSGPSGVQGLLSSQGQAAVAARFAQLAGGSAQSMLSALHQSLAIGLRASFWFALAICVAGLLSGLALPQIPLRTSHDAS